MMNIKLVSYIKLSTLMICLILTFLSVANFHLSLAQTETPTPESFVPDGYQLIFEDEFEQEVIDADKWQYRYLDRAEYGIGLASYTSVTQPGDGYLHLTTTYEDNVFLMGMIRSSPEFQFGYFEARIRFQSLQGHHGAFWLQSKSYGQKTDNPQESGAEIDIIEFFGEGRKETDAKQSVYWNAYKSEDLEERSYALFYRDKNGEELSEDFHVFALIWTPDEYIFMVDGVETWRLSEGLSHVPQHIILSLITSDWENSRLDISQLPDEMLVDYVRVYSE